MLIINALNEKKYRFFMLPKGTTGAKSSLIFHKIRSFPVPDLLFQLFQFLVIHLVGKLVLGRKCDFLTGKTVENVIF